MADILTKIITLAGAAAAAYGALVVFQGATEIAKNRRQGRPSSSEEWWAIVEGVLWLVFGTGGFLASILNFIQA